MKSLLELSANVVRETKQVPDDILEKIKKIVITFGTFDLLHIGHVRLLKRAAALGDKLIVGVSSDAFNYEKKGHYPEYNETARLEIVSSLRCVDKVFLEESFDMKGKYLKRYNADILVMGSDWKGKFDEFNTTYLDRTPDISTTDTIKHIRYSD